MLWIYEKLLFRIIKHCNKIFSFITLYYFFKSLSVTSLVVFNFFLKVFMMLFIKTVQVHWTGLPLYLEKPGIWQFRQKKTRKIWNLGNFEKIYFFNFVQKSLKNLEKPGIFNYFNMCSSKILVWNKNYILLKFLFCHHQIFFYLKT